MDMVQAPVQKFRGVIQFTSKMLVARPQGGVPVTGQMIKSENPDDPVFKEWKPTTPVTVSVYSVENGTLVKHYHEKLDKAQVALRTMKAGTWVQFPKVSRKSAADPAKVGQ